MSQVILFMSDIFFEINATLFKMFNDLYAELQVVFMGAVTLIYIKKAVAPETRDVLVTATNLFWI